MEKRASKTSVCGTTLLALIIACSLLNISLSVPSSWLFDSPFESSNCIHTKSITQTSTKQQCAFLCCQSNDCVGFLYKKDTLSCLHIDPNSSSDCMVYNSLQWASWKKSTGQSIIKAVSTLTVASTSKLTEQTTIPATTMMQPACIVTLPMDTYASTTLSDNTQFTFLIVQDNVNQENALSRCPNYNGTLVQIITAPKMNFLMDCLNKTFGGLKYVWIDAISVDGLWETSDGKAVLSDDNYWHYGWTSGTKECALLHGHYNYKMVENNCRSIWPFICETTN